MHKRKCLLTVCALLLGIALLHGCAAASSAEPSSPIELSETSSPAVPASADTPAPTATPVPGPVIFVSGDGDAHFSELFEKSSQGAYPVIRDAAPQQMRDYAGEKVFLLYGENAGELLPNAEPDGIPTVLINTPLSSLAGTVTVTMMPPVPADTLDAAIAFPPHDTPVRMLGLFSSKEGAAYTTWSEYVSEGKIFVKGVYDASCDNGTAAEWLEKKLQSYYPGMIDCVFCETAADALAASELLLGAGRDDMEIFSAEYSDALYEAMRLSPGLICGIGAADAETAVSVALAAAEDILAGGEPADACVGACVLSLSFNAS